jgi:DNA modification methylase
VKIDCAYDELVEVHKLIPNPKNNNKHRDEQIDRLSKIIDYQGMRSPVVVSKRSGFITKGHCRLEAIKKLGWDKVPVNFQDYESEAQEYADMTADNEIARWANLDLDQLNADIKELDIDIDLLGIEDFAPVEIEHLDEEKEDDVLEVKHDPITKRGDIWLLGEHRVLCGDSTMIDDVEKLMNGEKADMILTDPPYQGKLGRGGFKNSPKIQKNKDKVMDSIEHIYDFDPSNTYPIIELIKNKKISIFLFCNKNLVPNYLNYALENKRKFDILTWHKLSYAPSNNNTYFPDTEYLIKIKDSGAIFNTGLGEAASYNKYWLLDAKKETKNINHPTVKPQKILKDCILISSNKNSVVSDLFLGSGSTLIACEKTKRKCYGMELDEHYCDVTIERWQEYTGKEAILESTKESYNEIRSRKE